jgi:integrase
LRRNEAVSLVWNDIIDNNGRYYLHIGSKEKNKRRLPLSQITVDAFERWRELQVPVNGRHPVLTRIIKGGTITRTRLDDHSIVAILHKAAQRAGLPKITPDELRFASARVAYEAGMPLEVIQQMLGHTSFTTTAKYLRIEAGHSMEIDDIWSEELWE